MHYYKPGVLFSLLKMHYFFISEKDKMLHFIHLFIISNKIVGFIMYLPYNNIVFR